MNLRDVLSCTVQRIQLCDVKSDDTHSTSPNTHFRFEGGAAIYSEAAVDLWERMIALPDGEQSRCHSPRYAVQLSFVNGEYQVAAICWECSNISICINGEFFWQTFDSEASAAQQLLRDIQLYADSHAPE